VGTKGTGGRVQQIGAICGAIQRAGTETVKVIAKLK